MAKTLTRWRPGMLKLKVERLEEKHEKVRSEFRYGRLERTMVLPLGAVEDNATATYVNGILEITVKVGEPKEAGRHILIEMPKPRTVKARAAPYGWEVSIVSRTARSVPRLRRCDTNIAVVGATRKRSGPSREACDQSAVGVVTTTPASMGYRLLADTSMVAHLGFLAYVVVGGFLAWRWPRAIWPHVVLVRMGSVDRRIPSRLPADLHGGPGPPPCWTARAGHRLHRPLPDLGRLPAAVRRPRPAHGGRDRHRIVDRRADPLAPAGRPAPRRSHGAATR
jgi:hypothetical protein